MQCFIHSEKIISSRTEGSKVDFMEGFKLSLGEQIGFGKRLIEQVRARAQTENCC